MRIALPRMLTIASGAVAGSLVLGTTSAAAQDPPTCAAVVEAALAAVESNYWDTTFAGVSWDRVRSRALDAPCREAADAGGVIRSALALLDRPAVRYQPGPALEAMLAEFQGRSVTGIGLTEVLSLDMDERTKRPTVITPVPGSPADRAGLRAGDVLTRVGDTPVAGLDLGQVMALLRRPAGTRLTLHVERGGARLEVPVTVEALPAVDPVQARVVEAQVRTGYLSLRQFVPGASDSVEKALRDLMDRSIDAVVLDLRENPGGLVPELLGIAGHFLSVGSVIATVHGRRDDTVRVADAAQRGPMIADLPLAVLVNRGSASAAEALAAALQSAGRALVVGEPTFRKGLAHSAQPLPDGSAVMVPTARLRTPAGVDILAEGVTPDVHAPAESSPLLAGSTVEPASRGDIAFRRAVDALAARGA